MTKYITPILCGAVMMVSTVAMAQSHEQIHIFRNDKAFNTHKSAETENITFEGKDGLYTTMKVTGKDGTVYSYDMSVIDSCVFRATGIPEFHVTLQDYPSWPDMGQNGESKDVVHNATLYMKGNGMFDNLAEETVEFRGRGNSTWGMRKKPYRFKMKKKKSVCGLPKAKTFALIANNIDCTLMRNTVALWLANYLGMPYSNHCVPVKVYFNGNDKGQYMLTEKIGIGGGSVDIDETTGMLFELDTNYDENYKFYYTWTPSGSWSSQKLPVMVKDPDLDEMAADTTVTTITNAAEYFAKWQSDFTTMASAVTSRGASQSLSDVIDIESAVNFFLVNAIADNHEMKHPKSLYIHKKALAEGEVYHFGPVWDFDWAFTFDGAEGASAKAPLVSNDGVGYYFLKCLFANEEFRTLFKSKLDDFYKNGYPQLKQYMDEYATLIEPTARENGVLWPSYSHASWCVVTSSYEFRSNFETLKKWIDDRLNYMLSDSNYGLY